MRIAVSYQKGNVYEDFGTAPSFKVYDIENETIVKSEIIDTLKIEHGALAVLLDHHNVNLVLSGKISAGSASALMSNGIHSVSSVSGDADAAVAAYLNNQK